MLTTLQVDARYDPAFLKSLTTIDGTDAWGSGPGSEAGTQTILFDDSFTDEVTDAVNGYDAAWLASAKAERIEEVAEQRKAAIIETFGFNGMPLKLDPDTENALSKAYAALERQPEGTAIDWEVSRGNFVPFDLPTVAAISDAAFLHVQTCFTNAKRLTLLINAATDLEALEAIPTDTGWPE